MLDAHQLNVFVTAAKTLNFTAAARQLHMTQPSVSQHIQALETHFDMPLFIRSGRHLTLTAAGEMLLPMAQELVQLSHNIEESMESLKGEIFGHLFVGCSTTVGKYVLPFLLAEFMRRHPKVEASCYVTSRHQTMKMLCEGDVHVALASAREFYKEVEYRKIITDPVILIAPLSHPWAEKGEIEPEELLDAHFILREEGSGTRSVMQEGLKELGIELSDLTATLTLGNSEAIAFSVQEGIGVGFVSQMVVSRLVNKKVAKVKVRGLNLQQDIYIGRISGRPATRAQMAFWDFLTHPDNIVLQQLTAVSQTGAWPSLPTLEEIAVETAV